MTYRKRSKKISKKAAVKKAVQKIAKKVRRNRIKPEVKAALREFVLKANQKNSPGVTGAESAVVDARGRLNRARVERTPLQGDAQERLPESELFSGTNPPEAPKVKVPRSGGHRRGEGTGQKKR